jgi:hypothetical protein
MTFDLAEQFDARDIAVGDVLQRKDGARWKVTKRTTTAIAVVPYRWYHAAYDWITKA